MFVDPHSRARLGAPLQGAFIRIIIVSPRPQLVEGARHGPHAAEEEVEAGGQNSLSSASQAELRLEYLGSKVCAFSVAPHCLLASFFVETPGGEPRQAFCLPGSQAFKHMRTSRPGTPEPI